MSCITGAILLAIAAPAATASGDSMERLAACSQQRADAERLACYDREVGQLLSAKQKPSATPQAQPAPPAAAATAKASAQEFGVAGSEVARKRVQEEESNSESSAPRSLAANVTALSKRPHGEVVFTLDNGHVWVQKNPQSYFPVKVGDAVTITQGTLGSFQLTVNGGRSTQVTRVQ
jgi:uncharacterized cupin superfamily protein